MYKSNYALEWSLKIPGFMTKEELKWIINTASNLSQNSTWVELGCLCGRSLLATGLSLPPKSTLISVDNEWGNHIHAGITSHDIFKEIVQYRKDEIRIHAVYDDANLVCDLYKEKTVDVIFLDTNHKYQSTVDSIRKWNRLLREDGIMSGHDYSENWPDVKRAVDEVYGRVEVCESIWFKKGRI